MTAREMEGQQPVTPGGVAGVTGEGLSDRQDLKLPQGQLHQQATTFEIKVVASIAKVSQVSQPSQMVASNPAKPKKVKGMKIEFIHTDFQS